MWAPRDPPAKMTILMPSKPTWSESFMTGTGVGASFAASQPLKLQASHRTLFCTCFANNKGYLGSLVELECSLLSLKHI